MPLLLHRGAIPEIRRRYFTDPELNIGVNCSRQELFERNGTTGSAIFGHGNFIRYSHYFVFGPDLPAAVITAFRQRVEEAHGFVSSSDWPALETIIKQATRSHSLDPREAAEEFHKLALECELTLFEAGHFRGTARKLRR